MSGNRSNGAWIAGLSVGVIVFIVCVGYGIYRFMKSTVEAENELRSNSNPIQNSNKNKPIQKGQTLPPGWEQLADTDGTPYYYHEGTETTSWDHPNNKTHSRMTSTGTELPPGWERHTAEDGEHYYENKKGKVQWDKP